MAHDDEKEKQTNWQVLLSEQGESLKPWGTTSPKNTVANNKVSFNSNWTGYVSYTYGSYPILTDVNERNFEKIRWKFQISYDSGNYIMFGIASERVNDNGSQSYNYSHTNLTGNYYFRYRGNVISHKTKGSFQSVNYFSSGYTTNYTITMELDLVKKTLSFWNDKGSKGNDTYEGVAFTDIDVKNVKQYYLAITLCYPNEGLTLEECKVFNSFPNPTSLLKKISLLYDGAIDQSNSLYDKLNPMTQAPGRGKRYKNKRGKQDKHGGAGGVKFNDVIKTSQISEKVREYMQEIKEKQEKLQQTMSAIDKTLAVSCNPDTSNYQKWEINDIIFWIMSLENGRFKKYVKQLKNAFTENDIKGGDLPDITRTDLHVSFKISTFRDRVALEKHFQRLGTQNEGDETQDVE